MARLSFAVLGHGHTMMVVVVLVSFVNMGREAVTCCAEAREHSDPLHFVDLDRR